MIRFDKLKALTLALVMILSSAIGSPARAAGNIFYVDASAGGLNNGSSWSNAFTSLQSALFNATSGDQIWVADGVYYPDEGTGQSNDSRAATITLQSGIAIYGGFAGGETLLSERNPSANIAILSGDIEKNDTNSDGNFIAETPAAIVGNNAYHVVFSMNQESTAVLDGFTITAGQSNDVSPNNAGGGIYNFDSNPTLTNLIVSGNTASIYGGGMYSALSSSILTNVTLTGNTSSSSGGGLYNTSSSNLSLNHVTFSDNTAATSGGGMYNFTSTPSLTDTTFSGNHATQNGGGMYNSSTPTFLRVTFENNSADEMGGGLYNYNSAPTLTDVIFNINSAAFGAGVGNYNSPANFTNVTLTGNTASSGGGGMLNLNSSPILKNMTFSGNSANSGGGMSNESSTPSLTNITFSGNNASFVGDALYNVNGGPTLVNVVMGNSLNDQECFNGPGGVLGGGSTNNLVEDPDDTCGMIHNVNGNLVGFDPGLGALGSNGGFTQTFTLALGSALLDRGTNTGCPTTDQRGAPRPLDGNLIGGAQCDIGAVEGSQPTDITLSASSLTENLPANTTVGTFTTADLNSGDTFTYSLVNGTGNTDNAAFNISGSSLRSSQPFNYLTKNSYSIRVRTTNGSGLYFEKAFTISILDAPAIFTDVPDTYWAVAYIERLFNAGITGGCGAGIYCPTNPVTRAQMAVFLLKGIHGSSFAPPAVGSSTGFTDVDVSYWAAAWIKQLAAEAITSGCGSGIYCPDSSVTRAQMAVFLLKAKHGSSYAPPNVSATFGDTSGHWAEDWIEQLAAEGITSGCGTGLYCPENAVTRDQMAVFLVKTFNLP